MENLSKFDVILMNPPYGGHEDKSIQGFFPDDLASSETADLFMSVILYRLKKNGRAAVVVPDGFLFGLDNAKVNIKKKLIGEFNLHTVVRLPSSVFSPYTSITTNLLFFDNTMPTTETWFYRVDIPSDRKHFSKTKPMELKHFDDCIAWWNDRKVIPDGEYFKAQKFTSNYLLNEQGCNIDLCGYPHEEEEILSPVDLMQEYEEKRAFLNAKIDRAILALSSSLDGKEISLYTQNTINACGQMDDLYRRFPEDMKKSILQYAIQGKLVEQRPEEGTGEELYRQIREEKQRLIKAGKIKKEKPLPEIAEDEIPFDIPESWKWVRLPEIGTSSLGKTLNKGLDIGNEVPYLCSINVYWDGINLNQIKKAKFSAIDMEKYLLRRGDLLICEGGDVGRSAVWDRDIEMYYQNALHCVRFFGSINPYYFKYCFELYKYNRILESASKGMTIKHLVQGALYSIPLPLPPLTEQKRIVAKLEEILPLCERLK